MTSPKVVDPLRWKRIETLWTEASKLDRAEREAFVVLEAQDEEERCELLELLARDRTQGTGPFTRAIGQAMDRTVSDRKRGLLGKIVGRYKIVSILGSGGSGTVYLGARADETYSAQVAVKVIDESATASFGLRFRAERQILASLNHPNIARLLDAGETDSRQPYLVMEYIHGVTLDRYCDNKQLDLRGRLNLFLDICGAVQFAHQHLIVHRDIKPANILVTADGSPKLLDFGIAKLLGSSDVTQVSELTRMNDRLLTPEYASPEQILGNKVTTASDVYSLGIVLYQLLTGLRPYTLSSAAASQLELERSICVTDPLRPSDAVHAARRVLAEEGQSSIDDLSRARAVTPQRLARDLVGDLDAIIMRALRKEPGHRYVSVEQLMADIRRHLAREPVQARQGNWVYYSQRFIRRNPWGVAASASFVVFLIGMSSMLSISRAATQRALESATQEYQRAEAVSEFMGGVFEAADPYVNFGREMTAHEVLDQASRTIDVNQDQPPEVRARVLTVIGKSYRRMGLPNQAAAQLEKAFRLEQALEAGRNPRIASTLIDLAMAEREAGLIEEAGQHFAEAHQIGVANPELKAKLLAETGKLLVVRSQADQALDSFTAALELMRAAKGRRDPEVGSILSEIANVHTWSDNLTAAEAAAREAVDIYRDVDARQPDRVKADGILAEILFLKGSIAEAAPIFERVLSAQRLLYKSNSKVADTLASLAQVRIAQGDAGEAETLVREALDSHRASGSTAYTKIGYLKILLGTVLLKQSRFDEAETLLSDTLESLGKELPADHQYVASAEHYLGEALTATGKLVDAEAHLTAATNRWKRTGAPAWRSARSESALGEVLHREGRNREAAERLESSYEILVAAPGVDKETREKARERVARFYTDTNQPSKLNALMRTTHPSMGQQGERMAR